MVYRFLPGKMYRMPTHFGPSLGPRQGPDGRTFDCKNAPKTREHRVRFLTNPEQLEAILPEGFSLAGEPVVTVEASYFSEIQWLAGYGYNILGVSFPATFKGTQDHVTGRFLSELWEDLADPILTGREQLEFSKIYCELPEPVVDRGQTHCTASWMGFRFLDLSLDNMKAVSPEDVMRPGPPYSDGLLSGVLHYKYIPRTGEWGEADAAYTRVSARQRLA